MRQSPLIKLAISLVIGIFLSDELALTISTSAILLLCGICFGASILFIKQKTYTKFFGFGILTCVFMMLLGLLRTQQINENIKESHFSKKTYTKLYAKVNDIPSVREKSVKLVLNVFAGQDSMGISPCMGKIMAYMAVDSFSTSLHYGEVLVFKNRCESTDSMPKINDFDYRKFLSRKQIFHTVYLPCYAWNKIDSDAGNQLVAYSIKLRNRFLNTLAQQGIQGTEYAVASAILLGYSNELTPELRTAYQSSGTMHILCVSGLHVGLFAMVIMKLLFFLQKKRWKQILKAIIILLSIWSYALITGFSPSVLRASAMFTFITLGQCLERNSSVFNSLAISILALLFYDPMMLYAVGFQLSYLAVIGIVLIQKLISMLWKAKNRFLKYFWELITVSIAAQLATAPLAIHYFHQFPNYFMLSNIIASPISVLVIPLGFSLLVFSAISSAIAGFLGKILAFAISILNQSVSAIERLPWSVCQNLDWSGFETMLAYVSLGAFLFAVAKQRKTPVWMSLSCLILMAGNMFVREIVKMQNFLL